MAGLAAPGCFLEINGTFSPPFLISRSPYFTPTFSSLLNPYFNFLGEIPSREISAELERTVKMWGEKILFVNFVRSWSSHEAIYMSLVRIPCSPDKGNELNCLKCWNVLSSQCLVLSSCDRMLSGRINYLTSHSSLRTDVGDTKWKALRIQSRKRFAGAPNNSSLLNYVVFFLFLVELILDLRYLPVKGTK